MARYRASVDARASQDEVFAYLADFSNAQEWDPGVKQAQRLDSGALKVGSSFRLTVEYMGRTNALVYTITQFDPPRRVTFSGENSIVTSLDTITCEAAGDGTSVTYDADLRLKGVLKLADPLLALAFNRIADSALAGLRRQLG